VTTTLQHDLEEHLNFYEDNLERYIERGAAHCCPNVPGPDQSDHLAPFWDSNVWHFSGGVKSSLPGILV